MGSRFWLAFIGAMTATLAAIALAGLGTAKIFVSTPPEKYFSSFFEFELAPGWQCARDGTETVCSVGPKPHPAIAILAMKYRGKDDTLDAYYKHLQQPITTTNTDGTTNVSQVREITRRRIGSHEWVDAMHYESELPNFFTHYLATVTSHIGVLVTFSAHRDYYEKYKSEFFMMIGSLVIYQNDVRLPDQMK